MKNDGPFPSMAGRREGSERPGKARRCAFLPLLLFLLLLAAVLSAASCAGHDPAPVQADLILVDGAVYTMDQSRPRAAAVAVSGGRIIFVGGDSEALKLRGGSTRVIDLHGKMVLPAFQDSHIHLVTGGIELGRCNLNGLKTKKDILARVKEYASANPDLPWVTGGGWDLPIFPQANPRREDLDAIVPDRPVVLDSADGHSIWVNSRALKMAGVSTSTPDPVGGRIERDPATGLPSGTLRETAAHLVEDMVPEPGPDEYIRGLKAGMRLANSHGITSIIEARADRKVLDAYAALDRAGELSVRVLASLEVDTDKGPADVPRLEGLRRLFKGNRLKADAAKIFIDGVMEPETAALLTPYVDRPGDPGRPLMEPEAFNALTTALDAAGFQVHVHAIGDRAIRMSLNAFEAAARANGRKDLRHHIAHLELIDPADIPRFKELGVTANFQALWACADTYITELTLPILGPARSRWLYPIGSVNKTGAMIVGGSDWSVSSLDPLEAIETAMTRRDPAAPAGEGWIPEEKVSLGSMLRAYTVNGAWLAHDEASRGTLVPGKEADIVVLEHDLFGLPADGISEVRVLLTLIEGKVVYKDAALNEGWTVY